MMNRIILLAALLSSAAAAAPKFVPPLDQKRIHASYKESEFDIVSQELEKYARVYQNRNWLREDSVFLYKHLAVVYTASPDSREKGKYYMIAMLRIMPSAEILDMYVSEEVDRIFLRTRQEFMANMKLFGVDTTAMKIPTIPPSKDKGLAGDPGTKGDAKDQKDGKAAPAAKSNTGWKVAAWTAGGLVLAAAGASTYFLMQEPETKEQVNTIDIPKNKN